MASLAYSSSSSGAEVVEVVVVVVVVEEEVGVVLCVRRMQAGVRNGRGGRGARKIVELKRLKRRIGMREAIVVSVLKSLGHRVLFCFSLQCFSEWKESE
jgi:hypothetical protein